MDTIGRSIPRIEDPRLITGHGRYTNDHNEPHQAYLYVLRSPHAHARIIRIDTTAAAKSKGVLCVLTGKDYLAEHLGTPPGMLPPIGPRTRVCGSLYNPINILLPHDKVRHVGEPVAIIVGETLADAQDASEQIDIEYEQLEAVSSIEEALTTNSAATLIWDDAPNNLCGRIEIGDTEACDKAFAQANHVVKTTVRNNRVIGFPVEPRAALGYVDHITHQLTLITGTQMPNSVHQHLAKDVFRISEDQVRVISPDMGGGFGTRAAIFPEHVFVLWSARKLGRPVKWQGDRTEAFLSDSHGRDSLWSAELALSEGGNILGLRAETWSNLGAYPGHAGALVPVFASPRVQTGCYRIPALDMKVNVLFTNTCNVAPYRGSGQPEAIYLIERLLDLAAIELNLNRVQLRKQNLIAPAQFPYLTAAGAEYDSGEYDAGLDIAMERADCEGFSERALAAKKTGRRRGLGIANYVQVSGGAPEEWGKLEVDPTGEIRFFVGTHSHGQSHHTTFAQIVSAQLGVPTDAVKVIEGDTACVRYGSGTHGSRSLFKGSEVARHCGERIISKARRLAALRYTTSEDLVEMRDDHYAIKGTNFACDLFELAKFAHEQISLGALEKDGALVAEGTLSIFSSNFPSGTHICEVEVDIDTGAFEVVRYTAVDDAGRLINPMICEGQIHGGIAQGIGQALMEEIVYSGGSAQLVTASLMDYAVPRATHLPNLDVTFQEVPSPTNALGIKGIGESGTTGAPPAVISAVVDALREFGVKHIDMPATPEKVWRAIHRSEEQNS